MKIILNLNLFFEGIHLIWDFKEYAWTQVSENKLNILNN